jgi:hypothetical protein
MRRSSDSSTATGASTVLATAVKPSGTAVMESKWLIHTSLDASGAGPSRVEPPWADRVVRPYSPRPVRDTSPPSWLATSWAP